MTCLQMILARQRGRAWTVVRQTRESQMGESNLDNQQYPPIRKSRHTKAEAWIGHAARKEGLGGDNDLLRRNWVSQATGHAISRYQVRPAFVCLAVSPVLHMQPGCPGKTSA